MAIDYSKMASQYDAMKKQQEAKQAPVYSDNSQDIESAAQPSGSSGIFGTLGNIAKEGYKSVVRPFATPFAGFYSGLTGKDVELPEWAGGAKGSVDLDKQARIAGGAALEAASLVPAGKALSTLRTLKKAPLGALALKEAKYGLKTGAAGAMGYELGQNEDATVESVAGAGLFGGAVGGLIGGALPIFGRGISKASSWSKSADEAVEAAMKSQEKAVPMTRWDKVKPPEEVAIKQPLAEIDDDIFPVVAPDAVPVAEPLKKQAQKNGFKEWQVNLVSEMGTEEKAVARKLVDMAENKSQNILAKSPYEEAAKPIVNQVKHLQTVRRKSGQALDDLVENMPNEAISLEEPVGAFDNWINDRGIRMVTDRKTGRQMLSFRGSKFSMSASAKDRKIIQEVFNELHPARAQGGMSYRTPKEIRTIRQRLFKVLESQKKATDVFSPETESLITSVRQELNTPLTALSDEYALANRNYAIASSKLNSFMKFLGKDFFAAEDEDIASRVGELLPRLISNVGAKPGVILKELAEGAVETGMAKEAIQDPRRLIHVAEMLNDLYDIKAPRGFQGSIERAGANMIEGAKLATDVATVNPVSALERGIKMFTGDPKIKQRQLLKQMLDYGYQSPKVKAAATAKTALKQDAKANRIDLSKRKQMPNLSDADRAIETKAFQKNDSQLDEILTAYNKKYGKVVNTDDFRSFYDGYKGTNAAAVHEPASEAANAYFSNLISSSKAGDSVLFLGGGGGSGKTFAAEKVIKSDVADAALTLDGTFAKYSSAVDKIEQATNKGLKAKPVLVIRNISGAWKNGVVTRAVSKKRTVPIGEFYKAHKGAIDTFRRLIKDGYDIKVIDNRGSADQIRLIDNDAFLKMPEDFNLDSTLDDLISWTKAEHKAGRIPDEIFDGLMQGVS